jgi:MoxR-like ATPase
MLAHELFELYRGDGTTPPGLPLVSRAGECGHYLAEARLARAVRTAIAVERPLLVSGEAGTGKTALAWSIASELGLGPVLEFHTRSENQARDALYTFDHLMRFYDAQTHQPKASNAHSYVTLRALGAAIASPIRRVVLIDEIDKAPRDFPNDLLDEIDRMEFTITETDQKHVAAYRPIVVLTSNSERQLPDPFLRRCVFFDIPFPGRETLLEILRQRLGSGPQEALLHAAVQCFLKLRAQRDFKKLPATSELLVWVHMLVLDKSLRAEDLLRTPLSQLPYLEALLKTREDMRTAERLHVLVGEAAPR